MSLSRDQDLSIVCDNLIENRIGGSRLRMMGSHPVVKIDTIFCPFREKFNYKLHDL